MKKRYIVTGVFAVCFIPALIMGAMMHPTAVAPTPPEAADTKPIGDNSLVDNTTLDHFIGPLLKDSSSAKWGPTVYMNHPAGLTMCGSVNSRNGFGGMTGKVWFVSLGTPETTVFSDQPGGFHKVWRNFCRKARFPA